MVYFFTTSTGHSIYVGKDKFENENLIAHGLPTDWWFHVDDMSSAHVYLRLKDGETIDSVNPRAIHECAVLVKANSIQGCKRNEVTVIYTPWANLHKTSDMVDGAVGYHDSRNVKRIKAKKDGPLVNKLTKTKVDLQTALYLHLYSLMHLFTRTSDIDPDSFLILLLTLHFGPTVPHSTSPHPTRVYGGAGRAVSRFTRSSAGVCATADISIESGKNKNIGAGGIRQAEEKGRSRLKKLHECV